MAAANEKLGSNESKKAGKRYAFVVGVDHAPSSNKSPLRYAIRDANALADVLKQPYCDFELPDENILLEEKATSDAVKNKLFALNRKCTSDDTLLFYFNGHGIPVNVQNSQEIYLCTADFSRDRFDFDENYHISFSWLREQLYRKCKAEKVLLILECCFAGEYEIAGPDSYLLDMKKRIEDYLDLSGEKNLERPDGFRRALTATGHIASDGTSPASDGLDYPTMTELILPVLRGDAEERKDDLGEIDILSLAEHLRVQQRDLSFSRRASLSGEPRGRSFLLAKHTPKEKRRGNRPQEFHISKRRDQQSFQGREEEFQKIQELLLDQTKPLHLGLTGIAGIGKSELACEIAYRFKDKFPDGLYWFEAKGQSIVEWQRQLAKLAVYIRHSLSNFDPQKDSEEYAARAFCKYLIQHPQALLIADDIENPETLLDYLYQIAGDEIICSILYTSQVDTPLKDFDCYKLDELDTVAAEHLLLKNLPNAQSADAQAARRIITKCYHHPLTLAVIHARLRTDQQMTLSRMAEIIEEQGPWPFDTQFRHLYSTLQAQWDHIKREETKQLFLLALCFPDENAVPLVLAGIAGGLGEEVDVGSLADARLDLERGNLIKYNASLRLIGFHALICEFGRRYVAAERRQTDNTLFIEAAARLTRTVEDLRWLDRKAQKDYAACLGYVKQAITYVNALDGIQEDRLTFIESILEQERDRLQNGTLWPRKLAGYFYQQLFNRFVQKQRSLPSQNNSHPWLQLKRPVKPDEERPMKYFAPHRQRENVFESTLTVTSVAYSPDKSKVLLSILEEGYEKVDSSSRPVSFAEAWLLDAASNQYMAFFEGHIQEIAQVAFSPDGNSILTGSTDSTARLWEISTGKEVHCFEGHIDAVTTIAFSPDGSLIATGSADRTVQLWDAQSKHQLHIFYEHLDEVTSVAFSPDGRYLLTSSQDAIARLWNVSTKELIAMLTGHQAGITHATFSSDGSNILTASVDKTVRRWDALTGETVQIFEEHTDTVIKALFAPDNFSIVTVSLDGNIRSWPIKGKGQSLVSIQNSGSMSDISLSADGKQLLAGYTAGYALLWDITPKRQGNVDETTLTPHQTALKALAIDHQGTFLIAIDQNAAWLWDVASTKSLLKRPLQEQSCFCAAFNQQRHTVLGTRDGKLTIYAAEKDPIRLDCNRQMVNVDEGQAGEDAGNDKEDANDEEQDREGFDYDNGKANNQDNKQTDADKFKDALDDISINSGVTVVTFAPDGKEIIAGFTDGRLELWRVKKDEDEPLVQYPGHTNTITSLAFASDRPYFLSGSKDGTVRLWNYQYEDSLGIFPCYNETHTAQVVGVAFAPDNRTVLTSASLQTISGDGNETTQTRIWDRATGKWQQFPDEHHSAIHIFAFSPGGTLLLTCDLQSEVRLWQVISSQVYHLLAGYATPYPTGAMHWLDEKRFLLVDNGGEYLRPRFHNLQVEGIP